MQSWIKFLISLVLTVVLVFILAKPHPNMGIRFAPAKFLDPFYGFWQNAEAEKTGEEIQLKMENLEDEVEIVFDERQVPHIFAQNLNDAAFAQGYVTAQHRLWQMEFQIMVASGRLTEIVGNPGGRVLEMDRENRRKGIPYAAKVALEEVRKSPETFDAIQAYTHGINAYINQLTAKDFPLEYKILNYQPEEWSPYKTCLLLKYMANDLTSGGVRDFEHTYAHQIWGEEMFNLLYPERPYAESPIIPVERVWDFENVKDAPPIPADYNPDSVFLRLPKVKPTKPEEGLGSNNWAVSGTKTATGKPLLSNDPHLGLNFPSIWYEVQISIPEHSVYGISLPGAPAVIIGFNDSIAWGVTNAGRDVMDFYRLHESPEHPGKYLLNGEWMPYDTVVEVHNIRGEGAFNDTVLYTSFGPVMYDENYGETGFNDKIAIRWMAFERTNESKTFLGLNAANNYEDYTKALETYGCPAQNFVFASRSGDIALWQQGKFVNKWNEQGRFLLDASDSTHHWNDFIPQKQNPHVLNPERGFVSSANQHTTDLSYPYYYNGRFEAYRNRRLNELLGSLEQATVADMKRIQLDNYSLYAADVLPRMLKLLDMTEMDDQKLKLVKELGDWNYSYEHDYTAPTVFELWWKMLYASIWQDEYDREGVDLDYPSYSTTIGLLNDTTAFAFFDNVLTAQEESREMLINQSFHQMVDSLLRYDTDPDNWRWGGYKGTTVRHLARIPAFSREVDVSGNKKILNATGKHHGASWRMVVSLTDQLEAYGVYPGGQSGNPGSKYYDSFLDSWVEGNYFRLWKMSSPRDTDGTVSHTLTFIKK